MQLETIQTVHTVLLRLLLWAWHVCVFVCVCVHPSIKQTHTHTHSLTSKSHSQTLGMGIGPLAGPYIHPRTVYTILYGPTFLVYIPALPGPFHFWFLSRCLGTKKLTLSELGFCCKIFSVNFLNFVRCVLYNQPPNDFFFFNVVTLHR